MNCQEQLDLRLEAIGPASTIYKLREDAAAKLDNAGN
jgi:hypothetical protein